LQSLAILLAGYLLVMLPWWARNLNEIGSPFASGLTRSLWFTDYDDLYLFPASALTVERWWSQGLGAIAGVRLQALFSNLQSLVVVNGLVFLTPLVIWGAWRHRFDPWVRIHAVYLGALLVVMSLVFPFAGPRGGFFHSSVAAMPMIWTLSALGLTSFIDTGVRRRGWQATSAERVFGLAAVGLAALLTCFVYQQRVIGQGAGGLAWQFSEARHQAIVKAFPALRASNRAIAANDPPGLYLAAGVPVVPIPDGGTDLLQQAAERYDVGWVVLELDHPKALSELYSNPEGAEGLRFAGQAVTPQGHPVYLFEVVRGGEGG